MLRTRLFIFFGLLAISAIWESIDLVPSMRSFLKLRIIDKGANITYYLGNGGNSVLNIGNKVAIHKPQI